MRVKVWVPNLKSEYEEPNPCPRRYDRQMFTHKSFCLAGAGKRKS
jgi:hypothetical protein